MLGIEITTTMGIIITATIALIAIIATILSYRYGTLIGMWISFIVFNVSAIMLVIYLQEKSNIDKNKKFHLYELKLSDNTIVRDSLYNEKEYFYDKRGTEYYKTNIIYSKKIDYGK